MMKMSTKKLPLLLGVALIVACATDAEQRGYVLSWTGLIAEGSGDATNVDLPGGNIDIWDCIGTERFANVEESVGQAEFELTVLPGFNFLNSVRVTVSHIVIDYTPLDSVDPNNDGARVGIPTLTYTLGADSGVPILIGDGDDNVEIDGFDIPILSIDQKLALSAAIEEAVGLSKDQQLATLLDGDDTNKIGMYTFPDYLVTYSVFTVDDYGNRASSVVSHVLEIGDFGDCN